MARDSYIPQEWKDLPIRETPVSAARLNYVENGLKKITDNRALKEIYDDIYMIFGEGNTIGGGHFIAIGSGNVINSGQLVVIGNGNKINGANYCIVSGGGNKVSGANHVICGVNNDVQNSANNIVGGTGNTVSNSDNIVGGRNNIVNHQDCIVSGANNKTEGMYAGAIGFGLIASELQSVFGRYNVKDAEKIYAFIVGGGTTENDRKDIFAVDWAGNAVFAGNVTNGAGVSLNSLKSTVDNLQTIAEGGSIAKVFDTKSDLDAWLSVGGNAETLKIGQNIYITAKGTPDYWWDGIGLQVLETDKVEIESMTYDETMAILNATEEVSS